LSGGIGWIPSVNLQKNATEKPILVTVQFEFTATEEGELTLKVGDEIECLEGIDAEEEWWEGRLLRTGEIGDFPVRFTKGWEAVAAAHQVKDLPKLSRQLSTAKNAAIQLKRQSQSSRQNSAISEKETNSSALSEKEPQVGGFSAKALYNYEAACDDELSIDEGEILTNITPDKMNDAWWEGTGKNGRGKFPKSYASKLSILVFIPVKVKAIYDFQSTNPGDLSFKEGDVITILDSEVSNC
jgi:hypothetical protein